MKPIIRIAFSEEEQWVVSFWLSDEDNRFGMVVDDPETALSLSDDMEQAFEKRADVFYDGPDYFYHLHFEGFPREAGAKDVRSEGVKS